MLRIHYYRYDQDYTGWELWIWEKGQEGSAFMFHYQEFLNGDLEKAAKYTELDLSHYKSNDFGVILRRGGWHERDLYIDRYFTLSDKARNDTDDIYLVQDTVEIYSSLEELCLYPGFERAIFENFREIFIRLQAPAKQSHDLEPFLVFEDGNKIAIRHVTPTRGAKEFMISLERDMIPGKTYTIYKQGFRICSVAYGMIYDTHEFEQLFTYDGDDLGSTWESNATTFKVWAPIASALFLNLYYTGSESSHSEVFEMKRGDKGVWNTTIPGDLSGIYYTYSIMVMGKTYEVADPYAFASGVNGLRSMVVNLSRTNPEGWEDIGFINIENSTDSVLYEVHVRDITIHESSGVNNRGKFLGLSETDTRSPQNMPTALSHLKDLGITHVHLMPIFDFHTIDESKPNKHQYNWGYDPINFNVPEGWYATDPHNGYIRISELKQMIKAIKNADIGVILDIVYNHTYKTVDSDFNKLVPGYYYRVDRFGTYSNGSGCGNETASERSMVRHYIVNSVMRWAKEYKVDGFRFDLMGLHDIETVNIIRSELDRLSTSIILYGEGWAGGHSLLNSSDAAFKTNAPKLNRIGFFNDNTRDAIKGDAFHAQETGFISGNYRSKESVKFGVAGAVYHPQIDYTKINYNGFAWASYAWHCVNYSASHDNLTLYDKLKASRPDLNEEEYARITNLAAAIVLTCQGIPFFMLGTDFMRSKYGDHNSYNSPDSINQVDWALKARYQHVFHYHKGLIQLRKAHPAFRMVLAEEIRRNIVFYPSKDCIIYFSINNHANNDSWDTILVAYNAGTDRENLSLPKEGVWNVVVDENISGTKTLYTVSDSVFSIASRSAIVMYLE